MSWFAGAIGNLSDADRRRFESLPSQGRLANYSSDNFFIQVYGIKETSSFYLEEKQGYVVCGLGISTRDYGLSVVTDDGWKKILTPSPETTPNLDGHFVGVHWKDDDYSFFTDELGLRDIILYRHNDILYFTTSEEYLQLLTGHNHELDWETFSARWLLNHQINLHSIIRDTIRLVSGAGASFSNRELKLLPRATTAHVLAKQSVGTDIIERSLREFIQLPAQMGKRLRAALSAGMDSRVILSYLLSATDIEFEVFAFGDLHDPDVRNLHRMAGDLHFPLDILSIELPVDDNVLVEKLRRYHTKKKVVTSSSDFIATLPYDKLTDNAGSIIIDGGFGEIGRRRFFERIRRRNQKEILSGDPAKIAALLRRERADIFTSEFTNSLSKAATEQMGDYLDSAPDPRDIGVEQWLDLFAVRTLLPNYNGIEQARLDGIMPGYTPFAQRTFIYNILACPIELRRNARFYRNIIEKNASQLKKYPLVKFGSDYPFRFGALGTFLWTTAKRKLGKAYVADKRLALLRRLEPFVRDTIASGGVRDFAFYDQAKIRSIAENFYSGKDEYASQLDWWLSFELWRQSLIV